MLLEPGWSAWCAKLAGSVWGLGAPPALGGAGRDFVRGGEAPGGSKEGVSVARPMAQWLGVALGLGLAAGLVLLVAGATSAGADVADVLEVALLAVAWLVGRDAKRVGRRPGWLGGLAAGLGGLIAGAGYFFVHLPTTQFKGETIDGVHISAYEVAQLSNSSAAHTGQMIEMALLMGLLGILLGSLGGAMAGTSHRPGSV